MSHPKQIATNAIVHDDFGTQQQADGVVAMLHVDVEFLQQKDHDFALDCSGIKTYDKTYLIAPSQP